MTFRSTLRIAPLLVLVGAIAGAGSVACGAAEDDVADGDAAFSTGACVMHDVQKNTNVDPGSIDDPFAKLLDQFAEKNKKCPITPDEVLGFLKDPKDGAGAQNKVFVVSESADLGDELRFVIAQPTTKGGQNGAATRDEEIFLSFVADPTGFNDDIVEVVSFSRSKNAYVYYSVDSKKWQLQGDGTQVKPNTPPPFRCAACHPSGALNMKELEFPWNNWNSSQFTMPALKSPKGNIAELFGRKGLAADLEELVTKGSRAHDEGRLDAILGGKRKSEDLRSVLEQVMCDFGEINMNSSRNGRNKRAGTPAGFFGVPVPSLVDRFLLAPNTFDVGKPPGLDTLNLADPGQFRINLQRADYEAAIKSQKLDGKGGDDTFFALFGPTRGFVDLQIIESLIKRGVLTKDLAADILMTDFTNAMFSKDRCAIAKTAPQSAKNAEELRATWGATLAKSSLDGAKDLAKRFDNKNDTSDHAKQVKDFLQACATRSTSDGAAFAKDIVTLTDQRRKELEKHNSQIVESPKLFPKGNGTAFAMKLDESCKLVKQ